MRKILFLAAPFELYKGGAEYQYKILEKYLPAYYKVYYLFRHTSKIENEKYITYNYGLRSKYNRYLYTDMITIYKLICKISPDIIYKRGLNYITFIGALYAKYHNCNMIFHIAHQNDVEPFQLKFGSGIILEYFDKKLMKLAVKSVDKVIGQAQYQDKLLQDNFNRRCDLIIPNFHEFPPKVQHKKKPLSIVWIANLKDWKQPEKFIRLAEIFETKSDAQFIIVGGAVENRYKENIALKINKISNLEYLGELSIDQVENLLSEASIFVNTSKYEGFPNTFIQAWLRKVPVISLHVDPDNILKEKKIGFHSGSFEQMVQDLEILINDGQLRRAMGKRAQKYAYVNHGIENNMKRMLKVFGNTDM